MAEATLLPAGAESRTDSRRQPETVEGDTAIRRSVLLRIFELLEEAGIPYCLLHDYETLGESRSNRDIDCVVPARAVPRPVAKLLRANAARIGADLVGWDGSPNHYLTLVARSRDRRICPIHLDLHPGYEYAGRRFYSDWELLNSRRLHGNVWVPAPDIEFGCNIVKKIAKGRIDRERGDALSALYRRDPAGCDRQVARFWGLRDAKVIATAAETGDWATVRAALPALRSALLGRFARRHPVAVARARAHSLRRRMRRWWSPPRGLHVVLLGPDGAGKSTTIDRVTDDVASLFPGGVEMETVAGFRTRPNIASSQPHAKTPRSLPVSIAKVVYWFLYYTPGYWMKVTPTLRRRTLRLNHRYLLDTVIDPRRYRYGGPEWLLRLAWRLAVKPDLVVLLDGPPEVIHARKQEVPFEETGRQCRAYRLTVEQLPYGYIVDATQSVAAVAADVNAQIVRLLSLDTARRIGIEGRRQ